MFIVLEGVDGCGKSTQAKFLGDWLLAKGYDVFLTAEPTRGEIGNFIREVLMGNEEVDPKALALLFTADRYEHLLNDVEPALKQGKVVISERYYHSTIAYQEAQGVERKWLISLNKFAMMPDITLLLKIKPEVGVKRTHTQEIFEEVNFLKEVAKNYEKFDDVVKINANRSIGEIFDDIKEAVSELL